VDNNFRAALCHVTADAFVSVLVIVALAIIQRVDGVAFLDPLVAIIGSLVIISWAVTLISDTSAHLLDMNPDTHMSKLIHSKIERDGSIINDLHMWRLGPGHLSLILSVQTSDVSRNRAYYIKKLQGFKALSHVTVEVVYSQ
jgi:cation diffusion facilitator family transporter